MIKLVKIEPGKCWFCGDKADNEIEFKRYPVGFQSINICENCLRQIKQEFENLTV